MVSTDLSFLFANKTAETLDTSGLAQMQARQETAETLDMSGTAISAVRQQNAETLDMSGNPKIGNPQENNKTSVKRETLALFGQNSP